MYLMYIKIYWNHSLSILHGSFHNCRPSNSHKSPLDISQSSADPMPLLHTEKTSKLLLDNGIELHVDPR
jgi:hypothetical protein